MKASTSFASTDMQKTGSCTYVFCVTKGQAQASVGSGFAPDSPLEYVIAEDLAALTCRVSLDEWTGKDAEARLGDLQWLGPRAVQHEAVIEAALALAPVLPLRFGCLFSSAAAVQNWLVTWRDQIADFLNDMADREEWSLKGFLDVPRAEAALLAKDPRFSALPASPGARYLREQKLRQEIARSVRVWAREHEQAALEALYALVQKSRSLRAISGELSGRSEEAVFHRALLVPRACHAELLQRIEPLQKTLAEQGLMLELSGPWPPYNFCPTLAPSAPAQKPGKSDA